EDLRDRPFSRRGTPGELFFVQFPDQRREFFGSRLLHLERLFIVGVGDDALGVLLWGFWHDGSSCLHLLRGKLKWAYRNNGDSKSAFGILGHRMCHYSRQVRAITKVCFRIQQKEVESASTKVVGGLCAENAY